MAQTLVYRSSVLLELHCMRLVTVKTLPLNGITDRLCKTLYLIERALLRHVFWRQGIREGRRILVMVLHESAASNLLGQAEEMPKVGGILLSTVLHQITARCVVLLS